jgi:hypothetical protein
MKPEQLTEALESAAQKLGVQVKYEALAATGVSSGGGLCKVRGEWWVIIDKKLSPHEKVSILADALATMDTTALELPTKVRELLEARRSLKAN